MPSITKVVIHRIEQDGQHVCSSLFTIWRAALKVTPKVYTDEEWYL